MIISIKSPPLQVPARPSDTHPLPLCSLSSPLGRWLAGGRHPPESFASLISQPAFPQVLGPFLFPQLPSFSSPSPQSVLPTKGEKKVRMKGRKGKMVLHGLIH